MHKAVLTRHSCTYGPCSTQFTKSSWGTPPKIKWLST